MILLKCGGKADRSTAFCVWLGTCIIYDVEWMTDCLEFWYVRQMKKRYLFKCNATGKRFLQASDVGKDGLRHISCLSRSWKVNRQSRFNEDRQPSVGQIPLYLPSIYWLKLHVMATWLLAEQWPSPLQLCFKGFRALQLNNRLMSAEDLCHKNQATALTLWFSHNGHQDSRWINLFVSLPKRPLNY